MSKFMFLADASDYDSRSTSPKKKVRFDPQPSPAAAQSVLTPGSSKAGSSQSKGPKGKSKEAGKGKTGRGEF